MIEDENHPEMILAYREIMHRLNAASGRRRLTTPLLDKLYGITRDHQLECYQRGIAFPTLVAIAVPRLGIIEFARADLDIASIRVKIVNFVRLHPACSMEEVVGAFRAAWPDIRPGDIVSGQEAGAAAVQRDKERRERIAKEVARIMAEESPSGGDTEH